MLSDYLWYLLLSPSLFESCQASLRIKGLYALERTNLRFSFLLLFPLFFLLCASFFRFGFCSLNVVVVPCFSGFLCRFLKSSKAKTWADIVEILSGGKLCHSQSTSRLAFLHSNQTWPPIRVQARFHKKRRNNRCQCSGSQSAPIISFRSRFRRHAPSTLLPKVRDTEAIVIRPSPSSSPLGDGENDRERERVWEWEREDLLEVKYTVPDR